MPDASRQSLFHSRELGNVQNSAHRLVQLATCCQRRLHSNPLGGEL
jgi:hypothetical protein